MKKEKFPADYRDIVIRFNNEVLNRRINLADFPGVSFSGKQFKILGAGNKELTIVPSSLVDYITFVDGFGDFPRGKFYDVEFFFSGWHSLSCIVGIEDYRSIDDFFQKNPDDEFFAVYSGKERVSFVNRQRVLFSRLPNYNPDLFRKINPGAVFKRADLVFEGFKLSASLDFSGRERDSDLFKSINPYLIGIDAEFNGCKMPGVILIGDAWCVKKLVDQ